MKKLFFLILLSLFSVNLFSLDLGNEVDLGSEVESLIADKKNDMADIEEDNDFNDSDEESEQLSNRKAFEKLKTRYAEGQTVAAKSAVMEEIEKLRSDISQVTDMTLFRDISNFINRNK